jgi:DNA-binding transcriptional ArsR family regulator
MIARRDVFQAIADPTRRDIIGLLAAKTMTLNEVVDKFKISQPAISKHMRILEECGLVAMVRQGREKHCTAQLEALEEVRLWAEQSRAFWMSRLDILENLMNEND